MKRMNCWEYKKCGREPGGDNVKESGVCPAAVENKFDGVNRGNASGRFCWAVAGTFCKGEVQGTFAHKFKDCMHCDFFKEVIHQEERFFILTEKQLSEQGYQRGIY